MSTPTVWSLEEDTKEAAEGQQSLTRESYDELLLMASAYDVTDTFDKTFARMRLADLLLASNNKQFAIMTYKNLLNAGTHSLATADQIKQKLIDSLLIPRENVDCVSQAKQAFKYAACTKYAFSQIIEILSGNVNVNIHWEVEVIKSFTERNLVELFKILKQETLKIAALEMAIDRKQGLLVQSKLDSVPVLFQKIEPVDVSAAVVVAPGEMRRATVSVPKSSLNKFKYVPPLQRDRFAYLDTASNKCKNHAEVHFFEGVNKETCEVVGMYFHGLPTQAFKNVRLRVIFKEVEEASVFLKNSRVAALKHASKGIMVHIRVNGREKYTEMANLPFKTPPPNLVRYVGFIEFYPGDYKQTSVQQFFNSLTVAYALDPETVALIQEKTPFQAMKQRNAVAAEFKNKIIAIHQLAVLRQDRGESKEGCETLRLLSEEYQSLYEIAEAFHVSQEPYAQIFAFNELANTLAKYRFIEDAMTLYAKICYPDLRYSVSHVGTRTIYQDFCIQKEARVAFIELSISAAKQDLVKLEEVFQRCLEWEEFEPISIILSSYIESVSISHLFSDPPLNELMENKGFDSLRTTFVFKCLKIFRRIPAIERQLEEKLRTLEAKTISLENESKMQREVADIVEARMVAAASNAPNWVRSGSELENLNDGGGAPFLTRYNLMQSAASGHGVSPEFQGSHADQLSADHMEEEQAAPTGAVRQLLSKRNSD